MQSANLATTHSTGVYRDAFVVKTGETPLMLGAQYRLKVRQSIARDIQPHRAIIGQYPLLAATVALITGLGGAILTRPAAKVMTQLGSMRA